MWIEFKILPVPVFDCGLATNNVDRCTWEADGRHGDSTKRVLRILALLSNPFYPSRVSCRLLCTIDQRTSKGVPTVVKRQSGGFRA